MPHFRQPHFPSINLGVCWTRWALLAGAAPGLRLAFLILGQSGQMAQYALASFSSLLTWLSSSEYPG